jgi:hypothetical protein
MAALAPVYGLGLSASLAVKHDPAEILVFAVPWAVMTAVPLLFRDSRKFNGACYTVSSLLAIGGCIFGGVLFLPAVLPLLFATPPGLTAPAPQACMAMVLAVIAATIVIIL